MSPATTLPVVGSPAPEFTLLTDEGVPLSLDSLRGHWVVLYFYPKDNTPGCTTQSCALRDAFPRFEAVNAVILGISADSVESHRKFRAKHALPFTLLADPDAVVCKAFRVWRRKSLFGHKYMGIVRTTFIIDPEGRIARVFDDVKVKGHAEAALVAVGAA